MSARIAILAGLLALSACGKPGEVYPIPLAEVRETLRQTDPPMGVLGSQAVDWRTSRLGDGTVVWAILSSGGTELIRFAAHTSAEDAQSTRVTLDVLPPEGRMKTRVTKGMADNPAIADLYRAAITEQVDARLENRGFDYTRIAAATMRATVTAMPAISKSFDEAAAASNRRDADNMARAYRDEGSYDAREESELAEPAFGEPMDGLK